MYAGILKLCENWKLYFQFSRKKYENSGINLLELNHLYIIIHSDSYDGVNLNISGVSKPMDIKRIASQSTDALLQEFQTSTSGLTQQEAQKRQKEYGLNQLTESSFSWFYILLAQFKLPFIYLLAVAAVLALSLGNYQEALMIILFVLINTIVGFYQEYKAAQTVALLKKYLTAMVTVYRDKKLQQIDSKELVPGDIIQLQAGDMIPADVRFITADNVLVDESILTGESIPVKKIIAPLQQASFTIFNAENIGFSGTTIVQGNAEALVCAIGSKSYMGSLAHLTEEVMKESLFFQEIVRFSKMILLLVISTLIIIILLNIIIKGTAVFSIELVIFVIALAVTITPEALPLVITFSLSRGALQLARNKVIVKRLSAIEDLGSIDILCSDKTGTLTENKLTVSDLSTDDQEQLLIYANLANGHNHNPYVSTNPIDQALYQHLNQDQKTMLTTYQKKQEYPFDPVRLRNSVIVEKNNELLLIVRGVVDTIIDRCSAIDKQKILQWTLEKERAGKRVLLIAYKKLSSSHILAQEIANESALTYLGLLSLVDPIKEDVLPALAQAHKMGITIKILTGDSAQVAGAVGYAIGLIDNPEKVITGAQFEALSPMQKEKAVYDYALFARVIPEQKLTIIKLLQVKNQVGYLGDGINDGPALKAAHVALVVQGAADIARAAADIILLKKSLHIIINGIYEGRRVYTNTIKYIKITLSSNVGNFYSVAIASLFINYLPMLPIQILLVNVLTDLPMIALSTDRVESSDLKKPNSYTIKNIFFFSMIFGLISSLFDFIIFFTFYQKEKTLQTIWFIESVLSELVILFSLRTRKLLWNAKMPSFSLIVLSLAAAFIAILMPLSSFGQHFFGFFKPTIGELSFVIILIVGYMIATELVKIIYYRLFNNIK